MAPSEGKRLLCFGKQLNYVWSVSELDLSDDVKKQKLNYAEPLPKAELKDGKSVITLSLIHISVTSILYKR